MKSPKKSILFLFILMGLTLALGSCGNSGKPKTESTTQAAKDSTATAAAEPKQQAAAPENAADAQKIASPAAKEQVAAKDNIRPSGAKAVASKIPAGEKNKAIQPAAQPKSVAPGAIVPAEKVVVKEAAKPAPAQEVVAIQPAVKEAAKVASAGPGSWIVPANDKSKPNPVKANSESLLTGKELYLKHCTSCHGKSGAGDGAKAAMLKTPSGSFKLPVFQNQTDGAIFYKIRQGKNEMPGYAKRIPDAADIWSMVNYLRQLK